MRGNAAVIRLLLDHCADPNIRDTGYDATPAGWAEHHDQPEARELLEALEQLAPAEPPAEATTIQKEPRAGSKSSDRCWPTTWTGRVSPTTTA